MSAVGDVFAAIAALCRYHRRRTHGTRRPPQSRPDRTAPPDLGQWRPHRPRQPLLSAALSTFGWNLHHTAAERAHAAVEGSALHTRVIFNRMEEERGPSIRVINGGGIPKKNPRLNQIYANVLRKPVLVP